MTLETKKFDVLRATATELSAKLSDGALTSVDLIEHYLAQIEAHNYNGLGLRAIMSLPPREQLLARAQELDEERKVGKVRGPLHGIPIIIKDVFMTEPGLGMTTTCGAVALEGARPKKNATIVDQLISQGLIILGKASMTEWCGTGAADIGPGYSAINGQTQSPYIGGGVRKDDFFAGHSSAGGSSTGSAVGVAAGLSPLSLGTETAGSVVLPANRGGLYAIRPTVGSTAVDGIFRISKAFDGVGAMARSPGELVPLLEGLFTKEARAKLPKEGLDVLGKEWTGMRIGFVDPEIWKVLDFPDKKPDPLEQGIPEDFLETMEQIKAHGAQVEYPVSLPESSEMKYKGTSGISFVGFAQLKANLQEFLDEIDGIPVRTPDELVEYNKQHADRCLPQPYNNQAELIKACENPATPEEVEEALEHIRRVAGIEGLDKAFGQHKLDVLIAPSDSNMCALTAATRYPIGVVPLSHLPNGQPQGLTVVARPFEEHKMMHFMRAYETIFPEHKVPLLLEEKQ